MFTASASMSATGTPSLKPSQLCPPSGSPSTSSLIMPVSAAASISSTRTTSKTGKKCSTPTSRGLLYVTRAIVPGMVSRGSGHVINLGSTAGHQTYSKGAVYCASKAAEKVITEGLKLDLMGTHVRVTTIDPGMVETEFSEVRFRGDKDRAAKVYQGITPLTPQDVAETILWSATRPAHVNLHSILLTSIDQANSNVVSRKAQP